jgi:tetratricopeptide (TPR) repeat protein
MTGDDRIEQARLLYERAIFSGDASVLSVADRGLDAVEADLALARGQIIHARFLDQRSEDPEEATEDPDELAYFEHAAKLYELLGDERGEGEALFWIGCFRQVVQRNNKDALPFLERAKELAAQAGDKKTMAEALRHLGIAAHYAGQLDTARARLEESLQLRRDIGLVLGVASNQVGLAYVTAQQGHLDEAMTLLDEAAATARAGGAHETLRQIDEARANLNLPAAPEPAPGGPD